MQSVTSIDTIASPAIARMRHRWTDRHLRVTHRVHACEHGLRARRGILNGPTIPDLDRRFDVAKLGVVLRVRRRYYNEIRTHRSLDKAGRSHPVIRDPRRDAGFFAIRSPAGGACRIWGRSLAERILFLAP